MRTEITLQADQEIYLNVRLHYDPANTCFDVISVLDDSYILQLPPAEYIVIVDKEELHEKFKKRGS